MILSLEAYTKSHIIWTRAEPYYMVCTYRYTKFKKNRLRVNTVRHYIDSIHTSRNSHTRWINIHTLKYKSKLNHKSCCNIRQWHGIAHFFNVILLYKKYFVWIKEYLRQYIFIPVGTTDLHTLYYFFFSYNIQEDGEMLLRRIEIMCVQHSINISRGYDCV